MKMGPKKHPKQTYWDQVRDEAGRLGTDGCTGVSGLFVECCMEHDIHYRTGKTLGGTPITKREADARLRACMMSRSKLGYFSPIAWWRWAGLRLKAVLL